MIGGYEGQLLPEHRNCVTRRNCITGLHPGRRTCVIRLFLFTEKKRNNYLKQ
jgi:hypothetical protein